MSKKNICLLGASGSIGQQSIDVLNLHRDKYNLTAISVGNNIEAAEEIIKSFPTVKHVWIKNEKDRDKLSAYDIEIYTAAEDLTKLAQITNADLVINGLIGFVGLLPSINAIENNITLALANKETIVCAGEIIQKLIKEHGATLIPVDSEHSAIFQALRGENPGDVKRLILTASGGSFRDLTREELKGVSVNQALNHPNWSMGAGITIDSATMFNKALEIIEAHYLFDMPYDKIDVVIHKESLNHSMVEFIDSSVLAQISYPDMRIPIAFALGYPRRISYDYQKDILNLPQMNYTSVDQERFVAIKIAYAVGRAGGIYPTVLNAAKEEANNLFLAEKISFLEIEEVVIGALKSQAQIPNPSLDDILESDQKTRAWVLENWS